jgi:hypothetical protein
MSAVIIRMGLHVSLCYFVLEILMVHVFELL